MIELTTNNDGVEEEPPPSDDAVPVTHGINDEKNTEKQHATDKYNSLIKANEDYSLRESNEEIGETVSIIDGIYFFSAYGSATRELSERESGMDEASVSTGIDQLLQTQPTITTDFGTFCARWIGDEDLGGEVDDNMRAEKEVIEDDEVLRSSWFTRMLEKASVQSERNIFLQQLFRPPQEVYTKSKYSA